jgi:hypothetical protein
VKKPLYIVYEPSVFWYLRVPIAVQKLNRKKKKQLKRERVYEQ